MTKTDDMSLFLQVVKSGSLAAAGRILGLSPASMTARISQMEERYATRLLNRTTRRLSLTTAGAEFYKSCERVVDEIAYIETKLQDREEALSGPLRVTAPSDFGRQYVAPALASFVAQNPAVQPYLYLTDGLVDLVADRFDLGIRYGNLPDSSLITRPLDRDNQRMLCAAPAYLDQAGRPGSPEDLLQHRCLILEHLGRPQEEWHFKGKTGSRKLRLPAALTANDGALIRQWALAGCGIALKASRDIRADIAAGRLEILLPGYDVRLAGPDETKIALQILYPSRRFQPRQVRAFMSFLEDYLQQTESGGTKPENPKENPAGL